MATVHRIKAKHVPMKTVKLAHDVLFIFHMLYMHVHVCVERKMASVFISNIRKETQVSNLNVRYVFIERRYFTHILTNKRSATS